MQPLLNEVQRYLTEAHGAGEAVALVLVDTAAVDRLDALRGFEAGDAFSAKVMELIQEAVRKRDIVTAVSRGLFACLLRPVASEGVAMLGANRILTKLSSTVRMGNYFVTPDAAVGIAIFPYQGDNASQLMHRAKIAVQAARRQRERQFLYSETQSGAAGAQPLQYEERLRIAIEENSLNLQFQPQVDIRSRRIIGAEALLRWNDAVVGVVPPNITVQAAESAGLMDQLTMWVVTQGIQQAAEFRKIDPEFQVSVNISPSNLCEADLPFYVDRALRTWNVPGANIVMEITETAMMTDQVSAREALERLKSGGLKLSVDDFGTGYSSMYYLAQLPLDELKIDLMFVRDMLENQQNNKIVRSLIDLAHNLHLNVVAEGVETEGIVDALDSLDCDVAQGYYFAKPMPAQELAARLKTSEGGAKPRMLGEGR